ncbi:polyketide synthase, partial [Mycobacterium uberis]
IADYPQVTLGIYNSPRQTVVTGPTEQIDQLIDQVRAQNRFATRVNIEVAPHSPAMDALQPQMRSELADLAPRTPTIPILSTTYEDFGLRPVFDAEHWAVNMRNPVYFQQAIMTAGTHHHTFIEISAHPLLTQAVTDTLHCVQHGTRYTSIGTLQRDTDDAITFHTNLNTAHTAYPPHTPHPAEPHVAIPTTPWQHTRHWIARKDSVNSVGLAPRVGTLLGQHTTVSGSLPIHLWQARLAPQAKPYRGWHRFHGAEMVPVSIVLHTILCAAAELGYSALSGIRFQQPIFADRPQLIQVVVDNQSISLASSPTTQTPQDRWTRHVTAQLSSAPVRSVVLSHHSDQTSGHFSACPDPIPDIAALLALRGVDGLPFEWSVKSWMQKMRQLTGLTVEIELPDTLPEGEIASLLDAAILVSALGDVTDTRFYVPVSIEQVWLGDNAIGSRGLVTVNRTIRDDDGITVDVTIADGGGALWASMRSLRYQALDLDNTQQAGSANFVEPHADARIDVKNFVHMIDWQPRSDLDYVSTPVAGSGSVALIGNGGFVLGLRFKEAGYTLAAPADGLSGVRYVVYVADSHPATTTETDVDFAVRITTEVSSLVRTLAEREPGKPATLWIVTRGVHESVTPSALRQSFLWGFAGVIAAEHPELWGGLIDLEANELESDHDDILHQAGLTLANLVQTRTKSILVLRDGIVLAPALAPIRSEPVRKSLQCKSDAAYLITGGMGALGLLMAEWLVDRGARRLVLTGRTLLPPRRNWELDTLDAGLRQKIDAIRALEMRGVTVEAVAADVGRHDDVQALLAKRDRDGAAPIRGIIHAAGVTNDQLVTNMTDDPVRQVMWPKIAGSQVLHEIFPPGSVDFFYLTASAAGVFGISGQGSYAAANSYLDALARARRQQGCHTMSLDWVAWRRLGFAANAQIVSDELQRIGSRDITPSEAFTAWEYVDAYDVAQVVVLPVLNPDGSAGFTVADSYLVPARNWSQMAAAEVRKELESGLRAIIAAELRIAETELDTDRPFAELGLNSLTAMAIRREAEQFIGIELSTIMLFNHPTIALLAAYLAKVVAPQNDSLEDQTAILSSASTGSVLDNLFDRIESTSTEAKGSV